MRSSLISVVLLPAAASALVISNKLFCNINSLLIKELKATAAATSYCSSYLSISTQTNTSTVTITPTPVTDTASITLTVEPVTNVETEVQQTTVTATTVETTTEIATVTSTSTTSTSTIACLNSAYPVPTAAADLAKRGNNNNIVSAIFPTNWVKSQVSQACSCLSIPTPTTTVTQLQTLAPLTETITSTDYFTPVVDITTTTVATSTDTTTLTETTTSTTTEIAYAVATTIASNGIAYRKYTHSFNANSVNSGFTSVTFGLASRTEAGYIGGSTTLTMNQGDAIPLTCLWANGGGVGRSHFQIRTPSGQTLSTTSNYFVKACDSGIFA